jgi:predicted DCC family thiol-disulfide oxidoreductase YuxK
MQNPKGSEPVLARRDNPDPPLIIPSRDKYFVLYDGRCAFCRTQASRLLALARQGKVELVDFQEPGALESFPGLSYEACMQAMHLVTPEGRVFRGFEAIVQALATRPVLRWPVHIYYLPGVRHFCDWLYRWIARNRYRLIRRAVARGECTDGTCSLHARSE